MPGQTQVAGSLIKGRLSEKLVLRQFPRWRPTQLITLYDSRQGSVFEVYTGLVEDGYRSVTVIGANLMHGST